MLPLSFASPQGAAPGVSLSLPSSPSVPPKENKQLRQDCGTGRLIKNHVAATYCSDDALIKVNSGARGEVKPRIVTVNAVKKVDNGGGIMQS
jgi:hypothetical protein